MTSSDQTPVDFITLRGGPHKLARAINKDPRAVRMWKVRNVLPRSSWPEIIEAFPETTLDELRAIEANAR